jgi:hypothetical protein
MTPLTREIIEAEPWFGEQRAQVLALLDAKEAAERERDAACGERCRWPGRAVFKCHKCGARRWAKNLAVQSHYDMLRVFCAGGCAPRRRKAKVR